MKNSTLNGLAVTVVAVMIGTVGITATMMTAFASPPENARNGWGDATSEEAGEEKQGQESIGEHASDPNNDGPGNDERQGLGNLAHPDDLGKLLDCADGDDAGDGGSIAACS